jgi:hypothetical protein
VSEFVLPENAATAALEAFEKERERLTEVQRKMDEETVVVRSKDRSLSITFDGRGEVTAMTFVGNKFRSMAPAELSHLIVGTLREGRRLSIEKMSEHFSLPGVDFVGLAAGKVDPDQLLGSLLAPLREDVDSTDDSGGETRKDDARG